MTTTQRATAPLTSASPPLLKTKLHPPPLRDQTVVRDRLIDRLRASPGTSLTLVAAPAGSGKTTLLGTWRDLEAVARPVGWVTLDEGDNDPVLFWSYVIEALRGVCPQLDPPVFPMSVGASRVVDVVLTSLVNRLDDLGDVALVLDDFHRISSSGARESVAWFIEHAPSTFQLVIATRSEPGLPVATLRARGALLELRAGDLGFTPAEADTLFNRNLALDVEPDDVADLVDRTEGWAAGIYLAALSLRAVENRDAFVKLFGGASRHVLDFLMDEVLIGYDAETQDFMLRVAVLDRLCGSLCDAVVEATGSAERLRALSRTNLFLVPLDDHGEWYRFHHLFAQLLQVELEHRHPGVAPTLHRRASGWYREHGAPGEAIDHALKGRAYGEAEAVFASVWFDHAVASRYTAVLDWLSRFPTEFLEESPQLLHARAWVLLLTGRRDEAKDAIEALERVGWPDGDPLADGSSSVEASLAIMQAAFPGGDLSACHAHALRAIALQAPDGANWSGACWALGMASYYRGELEEADSRFADAFESAVSLARWGIASSALAFRSLIAGERGGLDEQHRLAHDAAALCREWNLDERQGEVHTAVGASLAADGRFEEAVPVLQHGVAVLRSFGRSFELGEALILRAEVLRALRRPEASTALQEARDVVIPCLHPGTLLTRLHALERNSGSRARSSDLSQRELLVLRLLGGPLSEREIGRELYLSHNTVHSHTRSIYRKLGVSSRRAALERAQVLGIL